MRFFTVLPKMSSSDVSAISTTFTPPTTCTQTHLTLMEYYAYEIWLNYPVPVPGITSTDCYPSQYMSSYFSAQYITTPLPAPTPLVCPVGYGTILSTTVSSNSEYLKPLLRKIARLIPFTGASSLHAQQLPLFLIGQPTAEHVTVTSPPSS